ncbi:hypothetical protein ALI144C_36640 [Actinosynnema sp. ALI-1.44]|uniref:hypothetical protein n=1 Tax=Actinosynnema sp. ALI-1.44 TaxID=1933779 RepID=UPI00097C92D2|nr:hypothetical protein [Actinosynnema sp. ALI-1.44]ONI76204.1 hypothetical protein ALI144C_36640 [Actinosynnema sp. ALI-1.44]
MRTLPEFALSWTWGAAPPDQCAEFTATWASLRISVGEQVLSLAVDPDTSASRTHIEVPLYSLAEWVAFNWWSLTADLRPGTQISQLRFAYRNGVGDQRGPWWVRSRRHVLRAAGDGFWWPDVLFYSEGRETRVVWMPDNETPPRSPYRFVGRGNPTVSTAAFHRTLAEFVDAVVARLDEQGVTDTPLHTEWAAVRGAGDAETALFQKVAALGLDPYTESERHEADITAAVQDLPSHLVFDFFNGVGANRVRDQVGWLDRVREQTGTGSAPLGPVLEELRAACADLAERFYDDSSTENPWQIGFLTARRVRETLGVPDTEPFDFGSLFSHRVEPVPYLDRGLVAYGSRTGVDGPVLVSTRPYSEPALRFLLGRALWHLVCDREDTFVIVAAHTHRQAVARGFSLELLAPAAGIAEFLADPEHLVTSEDVDHMADHFGCGTLVVEHQLDNRVLAFDFPWSGPRSEQAA